jgi:endogenous inhibitor of DNA gyrase (YacG/DUF329 family)
VLHPLSIDQQHLPRKPPWCEKQSLEPGAHVPFCHAQCHREDSLGLKKQKLISLQLEQGKQDSPEQIFWCDQANRPARRKPPAFFRAAP